MKTNWQPIETAPKDGTEILVYLPKTEEHNREYVYDGIYIVFWGKYYNSNDPYHPSAWCISSSGEESYYTVKNPTHWCDLPDKPETK